MDSDIQTQAPNVPMAVGESSQRTIIVEDEDSQPIASTSTLPNPETTVAAPEEISIEELFPFPSDVNVSAFAAAETLAARAPGALKPTEADVYIPRVNGPEIPTATGIVKASAFTKIVTDVEMAKAQTDEVMALEKAGFINEDQVLKMSVAELKLKGLGRGKTGFCYSTRMTLHAPLAKTEPAGNPHPEQPSRIQGVFRKLGDFGLLNRMQRINIREAVKDEILLVHSETHWERVRRTGFQDDAFLGQTAEFFERISLYVNSQTAACARLSCGGVIEMCRAVAEGQIRNGFAIVRPPGHHAEPADAMGFCFFNNAAVAAKWLRTIYDGTQPTGPGSGDNMKIKKVLILDWDVHHGNGTQKAFWDDPNILYMSIHRHDGVFYPGGTYGGADMVGVEAGEGYSVNIPFPDQGMGDADYLYAFQQVIMPIAYEFNPDFVIVSAGYDAAKGDELGFMQVTPEGFAHMTHQLSVLAKGKLVLALEGGYNVEAIANSALACVEVLLGDEPRALKIEAASASACVAIQEVTKIQSKYWKSMGIPTESEADVRQAGRAIPVAEILKAHRTYDLYHEYHLYNVAFSEEHLEAAYANQLLCSQNVYTCDTLILFMHDLGNIKASFSAHTLDLNVEKTLLLDTSREVLDWALSDNDFGVIDVNFLAHLPTAKGQAPDASRDKAREKELAIYLWDNIVSLSSAQNVVLFGTGCGCSALMNIIQSRPVVRERVRACISVLGMEIPPELDSSSNIRPWYRDNSLVMLPSTHTLHIDARKAGKHQKKYGNIHRATASDEGRAVHLLKAAFPAIKTFILGRLLPPLKIQITDVEMSGN